VLLFFFQSRAGLILSMSNHAAALPAGGTAVAAVAPPAQTSHSDVGAALKRYVVENVGGFFGGSVSIAVGHPFDTVKVRLQAGHARYSGAIDCLRRTVQNEGLQALYRGMLPPLLASSAMNAVTFSTWQEALRVLHRSDAAEEAPLGKVFLAGGIAGVAQCSLATPVELVRTKLQVQVLPDGRQQFRGPLECMQRVYESEGAAGLYRGNVSMMLREAPAFAVYFSVYEATKRALCPEIRPGGSEPMWVQAAGGASTGAVTWMAVMPMDVISTRIQSLPESEVSNSAKRSIPRVAQQIWKEGGVSAFYKGLHTAILRGIVLNAVLFPVYEGTVEMLSRHTGGD